jgi:hypothetical protein
VPYVLHRVQSEARNAEDRESARRAVQAFLESVPDNMYRRDAWQWANDHFGMSIEIRGGGTGSARVAPSARVVAAADKWERGALAGVIAHPALAPQLAEVPPEQFRDPAHRAVRAHLVDGAPLDRDALSLLAELNAWAPEEGIDELTAKSYLLRMREREVLGLLNHAELEQVPQLTATLAHIRDVIASLGTERAATPN